MDGDGVKIGSQGTRLHVGDRREPEEDGVEAVLTQSRPMAWRIVIGSVLSSP